MFMEYSVAYTLVQGNSSSVDPKYKVQGYVPSFSLFIYFLIYLKFQKFFEIAWNI